MYVKGAPDRLLPLCASQVVECGGSGRSDDDSGAAAAALAPLDADFWHEQQAALSSQGLRVLALCR